MSTRSYLSIGDVLTLLRQEFPDVTISKIRFLESQGLVNPERTPSGYRKFYEHDVERLRWVLRQQREHFLPLKVIKDRLEDDGGTTESADPSRGVADRSAAATAPAEARTESPVATAASSEAAVTGTPRLVAVPDPSPSAEGGAGSAEKVPAVRHRAPARATVGAAAPTAAGAPVVSSGRAHRPATAGGGDAPAGNGSGNGSPDRIEATASAAAKPPKPSRSAGAPSAPTTTPTTTTPTTTSTPTTASVGEGAETGPAVTLGSPGAASLSLDDLCSASGLSVEDVVQLQEYGLLSSSVTAGVEFFDEEALTVAGLAARFAAFGIEARHLRLYKNAAEREAGFIEQVVIPMVRQRNPEARARATRTAEDLAGLGQQLRASLLRSALRGLLAP